MTKMRVLAASILALVSSSSYADDLFDAAVWDADVAYCVFR